MSRFSNFKINKYFKAFYGVIFFSCILSFGLFLSYDRDKKIEQLIINHQQTIDNFGNGVVVEIYTFRTGTKPANYYYPLECVLENNKNNRIRVMVGENQTPVIGDRYSIGIRFLYNGWPCEKLYLDEKLP